MIIESLPSELKSFLGEIEKAGFTLTLVGGFPRDFIHAKTIGHDLDFEIRASSKIEKADWPLYYKNFLSFLKTKKINYTELPYLITRFDFGDFKLEFSSPRTEKNKDEDFSHHHFEAELDSNLSYDLSFKRRDFTINAIGIELNFKNNSDQVVDPYNGVSDLKNGILKNVSDDFFHDSVRFLRLIRFQLKFDRFVISDDLSSRFDTFNLTKLSHHHFKEEVFKSNPGKFFNLFSQLVSKYSLVIPEDFKVWCNYSFPENLFTKEEILAFVFLQDEKKAALVSKFFSLPEKKLHDLSSFYNSYLAIKALEKKDFLHLLSLNKEEALDHQILKDLKNLDEKKEWKAPMHLGAKNLLIDWDDFQKNKIDSNELNSIKASQRSFYPYLKMVEKIFKND